MRPRENFEFTSPQTFTREIIIDVHEKIREAIILQVHTALDGNPLENPSRKGIHLNVPDYVVKALRFRPYIISHECIGPDYEIGNTFLIESPPDKNERNEKRNQGKLNIVTRMWQNQHPEVDFQRSEHGIQFPDRETFDSFLRFLLEDRQESMAKAV